LNHSQIITQQDKEALGQSYTKALILLSLSYATSDPKRGRQQVRDPAKFSKNAELREGFGF
jgi:hypothetical protein